MTVVIHVNAFTGKVLGGYLMRAGKRTGRKMTAAQVLDYIRSNLDSRCEFLRV